MGIYFVRCEPWCWNIYLQNWVIFGQGQMWVNIPAPWFAYGWFRIWVRDLYEDLIDLQIWTSRDIASYIYIYI